MSVINQMLKDLDSRTAEQHGTSSRPYIPEQAKSPTKVIMLTVFVMLCLTALVFLMWQMYQENQTLKQQTQQTSSVIIPAAPSPAQNVNPLRSEKQALATRTIENSPNTPENITTKIKNTVQETAQKSPKLMQSPEFVKPQSIEKSSAISQNNNAEIASIAEHGHEHDTQPLEQASYSSPADVNNQQFQPVRANKTEQPAKTSSLTISRKQMSPKALASQKMNKAERALADNKIEQAESLFEEILMLTPDNAAARKQLAALWFGRKSYQPALNLLQQGIVLDSSNQEFRLMKARIYLTVGQVAKAYDVLSVLSDVNDIEYQSLLANAAQQIGNHSAAANAYLTLVQLAPQNARYWLGLAIAYDSNSQFSEASTAYSSAINQGGLSSSAIAFAKQRMEELGE